MLLTTRRIGPDGFAGKDRSWNDRAVLQEWRQEWGGLCEPALERAHSPERVDRWIRERAAEAQRQRGRERKLERDRDDRSFDRDDWFGR